jgi:hypothetical protein
MAEFDIKQAVIKRRDACVKFKDGKPSKDRREAMQFYRGENLALYGDSGDGLSTVVSRDTMEAIESMMPPLLRPFVAGEEVVSFDPIEAQDEESAKQATEYVNHVFRRDNNVLSVAQTALKDGLLLREGIAKTVMEEEESGAPEVFAGLDQSQLDGLRAGLVASGRDVAGDIAQDRGSGLFTVTVPPRKVKRYRVHIVAPDEFLREERLASMEAGSFFGHRKQIRLGDLIAQGVDEAKAKTLAAGRPEKDDEQDARFSDEDADSDGTDWQSDDLARPVWVDECYIRCDYDQSGVLSWRKVLLGGSNNVLLSDEPVDDHPYSHWTPIPVPHKLTGLSMWDLTRDVQMQKTALQREQLNNLYLVNRPQREVLDGQVNIDDLLQPAINGLVRVKQTNAVRTLTTPFVADAAFPMIEYLDGVREARTGVTRYNQGMDANSLNKTATGMNIISNNSQQRQELVARQFGEFLKDVFEKLLGLVSRHADKQDVIKLRGEFVPWPQEYDMTVSVGLGTNNKDQTVNHVMTLLQLDEKIIQMQGGLEGPLVTAANLHEKLKLLTQAMGFKGNDRYYTDPSQQQAMMPPEAQEPAGPSPDAQLKAETEIGKAKINQETELEKERMRQDQVVVPIGGLG